MRVDFNDYTQRFSIQINRGKIVDRERSYVRFQKSFLCGGDAIKWTICSSGLAQTIGGH